jgi:hypothetical protein
MSYIGANAQGILSTVSLTTLSSGTVLQLKSSGNTIVESDGSTGVLAESAGATTLTVDNLNLGDTNLSSYEEGTWTPTNGSFTTYTNVTFGYAKYVKIGRLVFVHFSQNGGTINPGGNSKNITGLPFTPVAGFGSFMDLDVDYTAPAQIFSGGIYTAVNFGSTTTLFFNGIYYTNS